MHVLIAQRKNKSYYRAMCMNTWGMFQKDTLNRKQLICNYDQLLPRLVLQEEPFKAKFKKKNNYIYYRTM